MGRHSVSHNAATSASQQIPPPVDLSETSLAQTHRTIATHSRPIWLRFPAIPAMIAALAVWGVCDSYHVIGGNEAGSVQRSAADVKLDLSALAGNKSASQLQAGNSELVSRGKRSDGIETALSAVGTVLPARPALPTVQPGKTVAGNWVRPSAGGMSSCFCMRWGVMHDGIDLAGPLGSPIVAAGDGIVLEAGPRAGFGHWILIQQANGDVTVYGHMYTELVHAGERVKAGQHIADIGSDGESTGPHLHFGVMQGQKDGPYIDPVPWLRARGVDVGPYNPNA